MSKKRRKPPVSGPMFEYYDLCSCGPHIFLSRILEVACLALARKMPIGYAGFLSHPLVDLEGFAEETKAKELDYFVRNMPLGGMHYLLNGISGSKLNVRAKRDAMYVFEGIAETPVVAATISILGADSGRALPIFASFVIAKTQEDAIAFIHKYFASRRTSVLNKVLNQNGEPIDGFRHMKWADLVLPDNIANDLQSEIDTFFNSEKLYKEHGIDWHRSILLAGPRGNGKTAICRAIATSSTVPVIYCTLNENDVINMLNNLHSTIVLNAPCIAIIEDSDVITLDEALQSNLINLLDGLCANEGVLTFATASSDLSQSPTRFDSFYVVQNPGPAERKELLLKRLGKAGEEIRNLSKIVAAMDNFSASAVQEVAMQALFACQREKEPITEKSILAAVEKIQRRSESNITGFFTKDE